MQNTDFYQRAAMMGHTPEMLKSGEPVTTTRAIANVDELKAFVQEFIVNGDSDLADQLFGNIPLTDATKDASAQGILRRVNAFVYGDTPLSEADRSRIAIAFPVEIDLTSAENYTPKEPVLINSPVKPQVYNYKTLTLNQGIYFTVYQTIVTFNIDNVVRNGDNGKSDLGDFNIFGATGTAGGTGGVGSTGTTGKHGSGGTCSSPGVQGSKGGSGFTGNTGGTGGHGGHGDDGLPSYQATITITDGVTGDLYFFTRSGTGGAGGQGGTGGRGGKGGDGGHGATCGCEHTDGGNAGNGGTGGIGGIGGNGGNGVNAAANIVVTFPSAVQNQLHKSSGTAPFGTYGNGGPKGTGGSAGGRGGGGGASGCPKGSSGSSGSSGGEGSTGNQGNPGTVQGQPAQINFKAV